MTKIGDFKKKFWETGKVIAVISLFESILKFSFCVPELVYGHLSHAVGSEERSEHILTIILMKQYEKNHGIEF